MNNKKYIIAIDINHVEKRSEPSKHYVYCLWITWSDLSKFKIFRRYSQFHELQSKLFSSFKNILPSLPPKIYIGRSHVLKVALERKYLLEHYCNKLISLDPVVSRCDLIFEFFAANKEDFDILTGKQKTSLNLERISDPLSSKKYKCLHDFKSKSKSELSLTKNELVDVHVKNFNGWWFVSNEFGEGFVPSIVLEAIEDFDKQEDEKCISVEFFDVFIANRDYEAKNKDEISLVKGNYVKVLEKRLDGWWTIESNDKVGLTPAICIREVNITKEEKCLYFAGKSESYLSLISMDYSFNRTRNDENYEKNYGKYFLKEKDDGLTNGNFIDCQRLNVQDLLY